MVELKELRLCGYICVTFLIRFSSCYEDNCDYLDVSQQRDHTSYLQCHQNGCCGDFKDRHCCVGPITTVAIVFGTIIGVLIMVVITGVCCHSYKEKQKQRTQTIPTITADTYSDIPLPAPPVRAPPVYNTARLHPPLFTPQPFRTPRIFTREQHPPPSELHPPRLVP